MMNLLNRIYNRLQQEFLTDAAFLKRRYKERMGQTLNLQRPLAFSEKIQWLKLNGFRAQMTTLADKVAVKEYVKLTLGEQYVIPTLAVYDQASEINYNQLPGEFILKANHGSGWNFLVLDKQNSPEKKAKKYFEFWLKKNYYPGSKEKPYKAITPKVIAEPLIRDASGSLPKDYKTFCFNGEPEYIQVDVDRFSKHTRAIYNTKWEKQPYSIGYEMYSREIAKPSKLDDLLNLARKLSSGWSFVRIDFYLCDANIYFGEFTFYPGGGMEKFTDHKWDLEWGEKIILEQNQDNLSASKRPKILR
ncbi:MAG: ATP-grasp fold amidoligase family protein [Phaeodactylibacter sp.]|uniref:ATP-grasp fold amidoligase family protein n=1 Tax=Phaeodactylibacter sp. TaxID=1940289 RepID=UPI0032F04CF7